MSKAKNTGVEPTASFEWATDKVKNTNTIWRYMDFPKFLSLLTTKSIYFPPASSYLTDDAFEGALPPNQALMRQQRHMFESKRKDGTWDVNKYQEEAKQFMGTYGVSCWHLNYQESVAMWKLYTVPGASGHGVAIESSIGALKHSVLEHKTFLIGAINYIDYSQLSGIEDDQRRLFYKRSVFSHEREFRIVVELEEDGIGLSVNVDLEKLIHCVRVPPKSPPFLIRAVQEVLKQFVLNKQVLHSEVDADAAH